MNKIVCSVVAAFVSIIASSPSAAAQDNFHFGILGGPNLSKVAWSPNPGADLSTRILGSVGGFAELVLTPEISIEARGLFVQKGVWSEWDEAGIDKAKISVGYLTLPLLFKYKGDCHNWRPYVAAGPELGFKIGANGNYRSHGVPREMEDLDDQVASRDFALDFGGGVEIPTGRVGFLIEGLYSLGLRNMDSVQEGGVSQTIKTRTFMINAGIRF